jgi:hypothetical protein
MLGKIKAQTGKEPATMDAFYGSWFTGWAEGMHCLDDQARTRALAKCGQACAAPAILPLYRDMLQKAGSAAAFFTAVDADMDGVTVQTVQLGEIVDFIYEKCGCPLHTEQGIDDPMLCVCSRESLAWVMRQLFTSREPQVELLESVLRGDGRCRLRVTLAAERGGADVDA